MRQGAISRRYANCRRKNSSPTASRSGQRRRRSSAGIADSETLLRRRRLLQSVGEAVRHASRLTGPRGARSEIEPARGHLEELERAGIASRARIVTRDATEVPGLAEGSRVRAGTG